MIKDTANYSIFKKHYRNREIDEGNVQRIMRSLKFNNLLHRRPIEVNSEMEVMDGQHRLEAATRMGLKVYYEVKEDLKAEDICLLNDNQKGWNRDDYLNFYVKGGCDHYIRLDNFMKKHKLKLIPALTALGMQTATRDGSDFKTGKFLFPNLEQEIEAVEILGKTKDVVEYLVPKKVDMKFYLTGQRFQRVLYMFFSIKSVDFDMFMKKLGHKLDLIRPASRLRDLMLILQQIYNWNNKNPVNFEELVNE